MTRTPSLFALTLLAGTGAVAAHEVSPTIVSSGDTTVAYVFPTSPQSFVPIRSLPSFMAMPGAEMPLVATQVVYSMPVPDTLVRAPGLDVDCSHFAGTVAVAGDDVFNLDRDGDGIGCEPEDR